MKKFVLTTLLVTVAAANSLAQALPSQSIARGVTSLGVADDVAVLLSKLRAKSTDEAVAKILSRGYDLSEDDEAFLIKLLNSSDGETVMVALERPVTSKLAELDSMVAEYRKGAQAPAHYLLISMDKIVDDINVAIDNYTEIFEKMTQNVSLSREYRVIGSTINPDFGRWVIDYPARKIVEMAEIPGLKPLKIQYRLSLRGNIAERLRAWVSLRKFTEAHLLLQRIIGSDLPASEILALRKYFSKGSLDEIYTLYNQFVKELDDPADKFFSVTRKIRAIEDTVKLSLADLVDLNVGLKKRTELLDYIGISGARRADIETGSLRFLKGAGEDGNETLAKIGIGGWAREMQNVLINKKGAIISKHSAMKEEDLLKELKEIERMQ